MASLFILLLAGTLFGKHLAAVVKTVESPTAYTRAAIDYFILSDSRIAAIVFLVSLFCMIFTTLDTLLLSLLQNGLYAKSRIFRRRNLTKILLVAVVCSAAMRFNAVSAVGVFIGSLMILPFFCLLTCLLPSKGIFSRSADYLLLAFALSAATFLYYYDSLELRFDRHFLIPGIVVASICAALATVRLVEFALKRSRRNG